jgi:hypothetical protein
MVCQSRRQRLCLATCASVKLLPARQIDTMRSQFGFLDEGMLAKLRRHQQSAACLALDHERVSKVVSLCSENAKIAANYRRFSGVKAGSANLVQPLHAPMHN